MASFLALGPFAKNLGEPQVMAAYLGSVRIKVGISQGRNIISKHLRDRGLL
ncbi:MAG: hypothetical protein NZ899_08945 [Thermoguttaceae bacterium]|nr:hypothetical protein [Thermoguttaceae bacterium]MDW8079910.1 hypothetical protein [Thermoguttaceae bacterium]